MAVLDHHLAAVARHHPRLHPPLDRRRLQRAPGSDPRLLVPGLVAGLVVAAVAVRLTQSVFVGVNVLNPLVYLAVALAQGAIVVVACIGPALRASRVDPLVALRTD